jgi:hypothetical protein
MNITPPIRINSKDVKTCDKTCELELQIDTMLNTCKIGVLWFGLMIIPGSSNYIQFNKTKINVETIIIRKDTHAFTGTNKHEFELWINGNQMCVVIPIVESYVKNSSTLFFDTILPYVVENEESSISLSNFSLDKIIPKKPYYYYQATDKTNIVVLDKMENGVLNISSSSLKTLRNIMTEFKAKPPLDVPSKYIFYNKTGFQTNKTQFSDTVNDDIYIDCRETNEMEDKSEEIPKTYWYWFGIIALISIPFTYLFFVLFDIKPINVIIGLIILNSIAAIIGGVIEAT